MGGWQWFFLHFLASHHLGSSIDDHKLVEACRLHSLSHDITVGISGDLGGGIGEKLFQLGIGSIPFAILQLHYIGVGHIRIDVCERTEKDVGVAAVVV